MAHNIFLSRLLLQSLVCTMLISPTTSQDNQKAYIVYMGNLPTSGSSTTARHMSMLQSVLGRDVAPQSLLYSYNRSFDGFVVELTENQAQKMAGLGGVVSVFLNEKRKLHTTRSWDFLGFSEQVNRSTIESDIIVGMLDTGIWPESDSFNDTGFGSPPSKWKGTCQVSTNFTCNNKIIGAQYYRSNGQFPPGDFMSPRDSEGHGTHTASTVAGGLVSMASLYGLAMGTARGGVPSARIAVYKVCWSDSCYDADILAGFDNAIADGVDIISISVGPLITPKDYFNDTFSIGAFHAMKNGILTSNSAGNDGPASGTITSLAPWALSVAASTIDRKFFTNVQLGNNKIYEGASINTFDLNNTMYPLIYGGDAPNTTGGYTSASSRYCLQDSLDQHIVKGKIILCDNESRSEAGPFYAGAAGVVMRGVDPKYGALSYPLPASCVGVNDGIDIFAYMNSTRNPNVTILKSNEVNDTLAPFVADFSSRGPNPVTLDILKPDLSAPGVDILAAWSLVSPVSQVEGDNRFVPYNMDTGTSMACPHVTGAAAYIKSFHPTWSPAAIKSALMTTGNAKPMSAEINRDAEFAYGAGQIDPIKAVNPGLIYDAGEIDYIKFLCGQGYNNSLLQSVTGDNSSCSATNNGTVRDLNYPSFALSTSRLGFISTVFSRTVTNVGSTMSTYKANITGAPLGLKIQANPDVLSFTSLGQSLSFTLSIEGTIATPMVSASLVWDDGAFQVRSPIVVFVVS